MALGRVPSVGLVPGRQLGVSLDDEPGGCAQSREGSSFHRLGDSPSGIEYSKWDPILIAIFFGTPYLAGDFGVPRYLTTCGDDTCGPSPSPSWGMKLLWAEPAGSYELSADP
ncbi:hypothetical protein HID58_073923 [Brassica napus]|uniref:Chlorophyll a-b binding protein, chloroplastic n=1 Tax=Brassica napus TaxID=3708 RepID=A0ABQ7YF79_BRANA|nr:hypothetical protein HID58_073923 [Brassica napus]